MDYSKAVGQSQSGYAQQGSAMQDVNAKATLTHHARLCGLVENARAVANQLDRLRGRALAEPRDEPPSSSPNQVRPVSSGFDTALRDLDSVIQSISDSAQALDIIA
jgi:hypothetical protein